MKLQLESVTASSAAQQRDAKEVEAKLEREVEVERETAADLALSMQVRLHV